MNELINELILLFKGNLLNTISEIISSLIVLLLSCIIYKFVKKTILKCLRKTNLDEGVIKFISSIMNIAGLIVVVIVLLSMFNFPVSSIIAIFTAISVGIGVSFKESLGNLGSGMILLWSKQFKNGDYICSSGFEGNVVNMTAFTVALKTIDNKIVTIPNSKLINDNIVNFSAQHTRRISISLHLPYGTSVKKVKDILSDIINSEERVLKDKNNVIGVKNLNPDSIEFIVAPWVATEDYWEVYYKLMDDILDKFEKNNIKPPCIKVDIINKKKHSF